MSDWQIVSGNDAGVFALDAVTGELSVVNASLLDAELEEISTLVVSVSDGNNVSLPATITINVTDVSEFAPQITAIPIKVVENSPSNLAIATLTATDLDVNSIAEQWTIVSGNESNFLSLDPDTGVVSTQLPVDANETPSFEIVVTVSDGTFTSAPTVVPVEVLGLGGSNNIEVTDIDPDANQVSELAAIGTPVNVQLNDTNLNSAAFTTLTLVDDADGRFILNPETGQIVTAKPIVGDAGNTYTVTVQAQSIVEGVVEPSIDQYLFSITVTGEIRNLTDSSTDINEILETQSVGSVVGITAVAEDPDSIDTITYSLAGSASDIFNIDAVSGVVTTAVALDAELENSHDLEVTATSSDGSSISSLFAIAVIDVNEAAPVAFSQAIAVYENDNNQLLIPMIASDGDVDSNLSQWRIDGGSGSPYFDIDTDTGVISLRNDVTLDFETTSTYELAVSVSDGEIRSAPTSVVVHVVDINEEPQLVTAEYETVTNFVGDIGQLEVIDPDTGDTHTFQIQGTNETGLELSESGSLQQINELQPGFIDVPVLVTDLSGASGSGIIRVSVIEAVAEPDNGAAVEEPSTEPSIPGTGGTDPSNTGGELTDPAVPNGETVEPTVPENAGPDSPTDGGDTQAPEGTPSEPEIADELSVNGLAAANPIHNETISTNIMASVLDLAKGDSLTPVTVSAGLTTNANGQATANSVNGDSGFNSVNSNDQLAEQPLFSTSVSNSNPNSLEDTEFFALQDDAGRYTQDLSQLLNERNRLDAIKLQLARLNGDDGKALILDIGNGKRLVLELLLNAEGEGDNEEVWLGSMFINSHIGASFSPKLIDALYALSSDMEDDAELRDSDHKFKVNAVTFVSAGLTLGFVTWLLHSGSLVASAITSAPLWQRFDPIPVLAKRVVNPDDPQ